MDSTATSCVLLDFEQQESMREFARVFCRGFGLQRVTQLQQTLARLIYRSLGLQRVTQLQQTLARLIYRSLGLQ